MRLWSLFFTAALWPAAASADEPPNLIANPGFEQSEDAARVRRMSTNWEIIGDRLPTHWELNNGQAGRVTWMEDEARAHSGRAFLKVEKPDTNRAASLIVGASGSEALPAAATETYRVAVWLRGQGRMTLFGLEYGTSGYLFARNLKVVALTPEWQCTQVEYTIPATSGPKEETVNRIRFALHLSPGGEAYVDDFDVRRLPAMMATDPAPK